MKETKIQWCDSTWNPWRGCTKVNAGCAHCYAEGWGKRFGVEWGKGKPRKLASDAYWQQPIVWNKKPWVCDECGKDYSCATTIDALPDFLKIPGAAVVYCACGSATFHRRRVFCGSLMDWLDDEVPIEWLARLLDTIRMTPNLQWMLLSKRCELWEKRLGEVRHSSDYELANWVDGWRSSRKAIPANVWIGTSVCDQQTADEAIPHLLRIPAAKRFVSYEPAIGPVDFNAWVPCAQRDYGHNKVGLGIHQIIVGGESGPHARPCNIEWIRSTVRQCREAGVKCFVKQLGSNPCSSELTMDEFAPYMGKLYLKDEKGSDPSEWPNDLRVREAI